MRRFAWVFVVVAVGCGRKAEPAPPPAPEPAPAPAVAAVLQSPTAAPAAASPTALPVPATAQGVAAIPSGNSPNEQCEVEIGGQFEGVTAPKGHDYIAYVAIGDCLDAHAHILQRAIATPEGGFFAEVFVPCGTDLTVCGSIEAQAMATEPKPSTRFGKLNKQLHAVGLGEIEFTKLRIALAAGPERLFPTPTP